MKSPALVRISALVSPEIAVAYRAAAKASGKSVSQVAREALEDHLGATQAETTVTDALEKGHPHAAIAAYYTLAKIMSDAALQAMTEAAVLDMDVLGAMVARMTGRLTARDADGAPARKGTHGARAAARRPVSQQDFLAIEETVARTAAAIRAQLAGADGE